MGRCQQEILEGRRLPDPPGIPAQLLLGPPRPEDPEPDLAASQPNGLTNRRMRTRMSGGVRGGGATPPPTRFRAGFTEPLIAFAVLRQVQVMTQTATLARLDYSTADAARAAID